MRICNVLKGICGLLWITGLVCPVSAQFAMPSQAVRDSIKKANQDDYQNMLNQLHITSIRTHVTNYDEAKANPYPNLPDPLTLKNGKKVTTPKMWWDQRRPEIVEDFDREVYGRVPANTPKVKWVIKNTIKNTLDGKEYITKELEGQVDNSSYPAVSVNIQLTLTTPATAKGPVPVIMEFGFMFPGMSTFPVAGAPGAEKSWQQQVLEKGWGYAIIIPNSIQGDSGDGLHRGIIGMMNKGQYRKPDDWGVLRAWGWGASRALDYFETDPAVDAKKVGLEGHSRYGKATLVAVANDPRFAIAFVTSSGAGGAKLNRHDYGEVVENVAKADEYHWMAGNYIKYAGPLNWNDLPVDSHELIALCAPRPVFISVGGQGDRWADPVGMFLAQVGAGPVYKLLGKKDLGTDQFPAVETTLADGELGFRQHPGGHTNGPNWPMFLTFAERYFK